MGPAKAGPILFGEAGLSWWGGFPTRARFSIAPFKGGLQTRRRLQTCPTLSENFPSCKPLVKCGPVLPPPVAPPFQDRTSDLPDMALARKPSAAQSFRRLLHLRTSVPHDGLSPGSGTHRTSIFAAPRRSRGCGAGDPPWRSGYASLQSTRLRSHAQPRSPVDHAHR